MNLPGYPMMLYFLAHNLWILTSRVGKQTNTGAGRLMVFFMCDFGPFYQALAFLLLLSRPGRCPLGSPGVPWGPLGSPGVHLATGFQSCKPKIPRGHHVYNVDSNYPQVFQQSYWTLWFIVDLSTKIGDFPSLCNRLPEGKRLCCNPRMLMDHLEDHPTNHTTRLIQS